MIKLAFVGPQRKIIRFEIEGETKDGVKKVVRYFDDLWKDGIQIYPKDSKLLLRLKTSRNPDFRILAAFILDANKGQDFVEYVSCKTEEDIAEFIRRDCKRSGLIEIK